MDSWRWQRGRSSPSPVGFLVVGQGQVRLLPVDGNMVYDRIIDTVPQVLSQIQSMMGKGGMVKEVLKKQKCTYGKEFRAG